MVRIDIHDILVFPRIIACPVAKSCPGIALFRRSIKKKGHSVARNLPGFQQ